MIRLRLSCDIILVAKSVLDFVRLALRFVSRRWRNTNGVWLCSFQAKNTLVLCNDQENSDGCVNGCRGVVLTVTGVPNKCRIVAVLNLESKQR